MLEINLLPKDYQQRKFRVTLEKNTLYVIGAGIAMMVLLSAYSLFFQIWPANSLDKKIDDLRTEASKYDSEIALIKDLTDKKSRIVARMHTIEILDRDRDAWIDVLSDLGSRIPSYLWLTDVEQLAAGEGGVEGDPLATVVKGKSFSINSLATFLVRLKKSSFFENVEITAIDLVVEEDVEAYEFSINCNLILDVNSEAKDRKTLIADKRIAGSEF